MDYIPTELILNIIISQLFFAAAQCIIEIIKELFGRALAWIYYSYSGYLSINFWRIYKDFIKPAFLGLAFIVFGVILALILNNYRTKRNEKQLTEVRNSVKNDITPDNVMQLLKNYVQYYDTVTNISQITN